MKKLISLIFVTLLLISCSSLPVQQEQYELVKHELKITIEQVGPNQVDISTNDEDNNITKTMQVGNTDVSLSPLSNIENNIMYTKMFSSITIVDVTRIWNDLIYIETKTDIKTVVLFIDSPGGDAFSGLALADQIEKYQRKGFKFIAHCTGLVASAAVPVFAVCDETHATKATIFMVHEASLWKWPGRETASDIRAQTKVMSLLQKLYLDKLVRNSNLSFDQWEEMEKQTSWFDVCEAKKIGLLDVIDN